MATVKAEIAGDQLVINVERDDGSSKGVSLTMPADHKTVDAACSALMMSLAGISEYEINTAAYLAIIEAAGARDGR